MSYITEMWDSAINSGEVDGVDGNSFRRILVPIDANGASNEALMMAARICHTTGAPLRLVHVRMWDQHPRSAGKYFTETSEEATAVLHEAITAAWEHGIQVSGVVLEAPRSLVAMTIVAEATSWDADVIVLTKLPKRSLSFPLSASVSARLRRKASCPVLVVRSGEGASAHYELSKPVRQRSLARTSR
ncbi:MAG: universal stress protein [Acidimicrobiales bacterium]